MLAPFFCPGAENAQLMPVYRNGYIVFHRERLSGVTAGRATSFPAQLSGGKLRAAADTAGYFLFPFRVILGHGYGTSFPYFKVSGFLPGYWFDLTHLTTPAGVCQGRELGEITDIISIYYKWTSIIRGRWSEARRVSGVRGVSMRRTVISGLIKA